MKIGLKLLFVCLAAGSLLAMPLAQEKKGIEGDWNGVLDLGQAQLRLVFHIASKDGKLGATLDSPDQNAKGIPVETVEFADGKLRIFVKVAQGTYDGNANADVSEIDGKWSQAGNTWPLKLSRKAAPAPKAPNRPQVCARGRGCCSCSGTPRPITTAKASS